ncbi:MAG: lipoate-protein ligase B [Hyphomicrobiaceae bacterium]
MEPSIIDRQDWGVLGYPEALDRQLKLADDRAKGLVPDTLVTVEHPPTISLGRHAPDSDVLWNAEILAAKGITVVRSDRGGRATYHGPGQLVCYPIVGIQDRGWGARQWVDLIEAALIDVVGSYGIEAERICGRPGVWTGGAKIASLGLRIARGVSYHGLSLNTHLDPSDFDCIVTCGVATEDVTTIKNETGESPPASQIRGRVLNSLAQRIREHTKKCPVQPVTR